MDSRAWFFRPAAGRYIQSPLRQVLVKKWTIVFFLAALLGAGSYLALESGRMPDDSVQPVRIDRYLTKREMSADVDAVVHTFDKIHPNPYRFIERQVLLASVDSIKMRLPDSLTTINFWRVLDQLIIRYTDAHSTIADRQVLRDYVKKGRRFFPIAARVANEKILVASHENSEQILPEGTEIVKINGQSANQVIEDMLQHATKETRALKLREISDDFGFYVWKTYAWDSVFLVHFKTGESAKIDSMFLKGIGWEDREHSEKQDVGPYSFTRIKDKVGLMKITGFTGSARSTKDFYAHCFQSLAASNATHLVLDFRGHRGGVDSYGEQLATYFAKQPFRKLSKAYWKVTPEFKEAFDTRFVPKIIRWFKPVYLLDEYARVFYGSQANECVTVNYPLKNPLPEEERFQGAVYLITDHNTFSAGSIFAEMFKYYQMGTIVGQPTGNLASFNGFALAEFTLPHSNLLFKVSSVYNIANNEALGMKPVAPDIFLDRTEDPVAYVIENLVPAGD